MRNYFIFGSCVSRDIFRVMETKCSIDYFARTSIISQVASPILINGDRLQLDSDFQKRMIIQDFHKTFFDELANSNFDYVIIDLVDERFDLFRVNDSYITRSVELTNSKIMDTDFQGSKQIRRQDVPTHTLWEESCRTFTQKLSEIVPSNKIILHEAYWSEQYWDNGELKSFSEKMIPGIREMNSMLRRYHDIFKSNMPGIHVVSAPAYGDVAHTWGLSPYHFHNNYYKSLFDQIEGITS